MKIECIFVRILYTCGAFRNNKIYAGIYANIARGSSVEVLLNFNASALVRNGLAALKCRQPKEPETDSAFAQGEEVDNTMTPEDLDLIAGGKYWREIVTSDLPFANKEEQCVSEYVGLMKGFFDKVCSYGIKEKYEHTVPKYRLLFGSRHEDAFILMNDAICNARDEFLGKNHIRARFPESTLLKVNGSLVREAGKLRYPRKYRAEMFRTIVDSIRRQDKKVQIALCKETPQVWKAAGLTGRGLCCNCVG